MPFSWDDGRKPPTTVSRHIDATPGRTFEVMSDPWLYPLWVVGAVHIRAVDPTWPQPGAELHHQVGAWPVTIKDSTAVVDYDPPTRIVLRGRAWPLGEAHIELCVSAVNGGTE